MRTQTALVVGVLAFASQAAMAKTITQNLTGTIAGKNTTDVRGLFGPAGANLAGKPVSIFLQYSTENLSPATQCIHNPKCTRAISQQQPDTPGSVLIVVAIDGVRKVYSPVYEGTVFFNNAVRPNLSVDSDSYSGSGIGLDGVAVYVDYTMRLSFGSSLSPVNPPVLDNPNNDMILFYSSKSNSPDEMLDYVPTAASR